MKYIHILIIAGLFIGAGYLLYSAGQVPSEAVSTSEDVTYTFPQSNLSFSYRTGETGYTLAEQSVGASDDSSLIESVRVVPTRDYLDEQGRLGELSPSWHVSVYDNAAALTPAAWAMRNSMQSNYILRRSEVIEREIGNSIPAISYQTDGLYIATVVVFPIRDTIVVVYAQYNDETSPTFVDLEGWLASFNSAQGVPSPAAKIDVQVACESALAYTTFQTGEQADAFIADCVAGNHPEVIERYLETVGVDGALI